MNRRRFLQRGLALTGVGGVAVVAYTYAVEPHWLEIVSRDLPVADLPRALEGKRLLQLSDLHVGPVSEAYLTASLDRAAALRPDIVAVIGDMISNRRGDEQEAPLRRVLAHLPRGRLATLAVLGNHDYGPEWRDVTVAAQVQQELERAGARVLTNDAATIEGLDVVGVEDLWALRADPRAALARRGGQATLALCHNPDGADALDWGDHRGWILAGHTHGGQCRPPFLPPPVLPVRNKRYSAGEVAAPGGRRLYISRGVGHLFHVRFNVRPEMTLFTLRRAHG